MEQALGVRINDDVRVLERAGRTVLERTRNRAVLITRGSRGMALFQRGVPTLHIPIFGSDEIADVTGAGDTVMATMTLALAAGASFEMAARLANYAGGLVVMKRGTATVSARELRDAVKSDARATVPPPAGVPVQRRQWVRCWRATRWPAPWPTRARRGGPWRWPTAASTCCTSATCATWKARRRKPTCWWWR